MKEYINDYMKNVSKNFVRLQKSTPDIEKAVNLIIDTLKNNRKIIFCGNGGSAGDSQHLAAELMGRYKLDRNPLPALALTVDTSAITAIANDYGYDKVFSRQLKGIGKEGDTLVAISTSGNSKSVIDAIKFANENGINTIGLTGQKDSEVSKNVSICIKTPSSDTNHIQEMHIAIGQLICGLVEDHFFGSN